MVDGVGDLLGCLRDDPPPRHKRDGILEAGPGHSTYLEYDARIAARAVDWLREHARDAKPWVLFVSFVCPHPPYIAPPRLYDLYPLDRVPLPPQWRPGEEPDHPALVRMRDLFGYGPLDEALLRNAIAAYYGACTYLDERIGEVLGALEENGLVESTRVLYTSDHGESLGARGLFGKFTMYEESAAVPLILAGPGAPAGHTVETPVSLIDCYPTILEAMGLAPHPEDRDLPGQSLWSIARDPDCTWLARTNRPQPGSMPCTRRTDLMPRVTGAGNTSTTSTSRRTSSYLRRPTHGTPRPGVRSLLRRYSVGHEGAGSTACWIPEAVDARAKADQRARIEAFGGRQAVLRRGTFDNSPIPGEAPAFGT